MEPKSVLTEQMKVILEQDKALMSNPKYKHLLENIEAKNGDELFHKKRVLARLMETQEKYMKILNEDTLAGNIATFQKYALPLIRRIFPTLPINDLVGIQPLNGPAGLIFTLESKYGSTKGTTTEGTTIYNNASSNYASHTVGNYIYRAAAGSSTDYGGTLGQSKWLPITPGTVTITIGSVVGTDDGAGAITGAGIASGTIVYTTGVVAITLSSADTVAGYSTFDYNSEVNTEVPEIKLDITSQPVVATPRKLRAEWSPEAQQDLISEHGVEGEATFIAEIAQAIQREISRDVVDTCLNLVPVGHKDTWSATYTLDISYDEHKRTLIDAMIKQTNLIYKDTFRGAGNVAVMSSDFSNVVETLPGFVPDSKEALEKPSGKIGTLNNRWAVLKDVYMAEDKMLIGYKGTTFMDTGVVYSPYVALMLETIVDPRDFKARKGFMTRDAITSINGNFYSELTYTT